MAESAEDPSSSYTEAVTSSHHEPVSNQVVETGAAVPTQTASDIIQQPRHSEGGEIIMNNRTVRSKGRDNALHHHNNMGIRNATNSFSGFLDILYEQRKLPGSYAKKMVHKLGLFIYYFVNFIYPIVAFAVQKEHLIYHIVYTCICFTGFLFEVIVIILDAKICLSQRSSSNSSVEDMTQITTYQVGNTDKPKEGWTVDEPVSQQDYYYKTKSIVLYYLISSLGEFLIYPTLICVMYGFINERSWQFDNEVSVCNLILLVYSVIMDALYMKFYVIFLVIRIVCVSYAKYDELLRSRQVEWKRYFTPVYLSILLAITTALTHWLMTAIIGVRIYVDNFTTEKNDTNISINFTIEKDDINSSVPDTGDYRVAPFTGYMIACTVYLPIVSWITYIILNKLWFYEVYSAIHQLSNGRVDHMPEEDTWDEKLFAFIKDYHHTVYHRLQSYIADLFLLLPFIVFSVGTYLPDYDSSEYEVASSARNVIQELAPCFIIFFLFSNLQAVISFIIITVFFIIFVLCGLPLVLWKTLP